MAASRFSGCRGLLLQHTPAGGLPHHQVRFGASAELVGQTTGATIWPNLGVTQAELSQYAVGSSLTGISTRRRRTLQAAIVPKPRSARGQATGSPNPANPPNRHSLGHLGHRSLTESQRLRENILAQQISRRSRASAYLLHWWAAETRHPRVQIDPEKLATVTLKRCTPDFSWKRHGQRTKGTLNGAKQSFRACTTNDQIMKPEDYDNVTRPENTQLGAWSRTCSSRAWTTTSRRRCRSLRPLSPTGQGCAFSSLLDVAPGHLYPGRLQPRQPVMALTMHYGASVVVNCHEESTNLKQEPPRTKGAGEIGHGFFLNQLVAAWPC